MARMEPVWTDMAKLSELAAKGRLLRKRDGKQIALFLHDGVVKACDNRCPHEGYPLIEGTVAEGGGHCVLTCNWHNWKFDLDSGETLTGGDKLRRYPVRITSDERIELDLADPPADAVIAAALDNLADCFDRVEYDRMAREVARLMKAGGDPLDALRRTIAELWEKFEYGASHAQPASADWLSLRAEDGTDPVRSLSMLVECIGHFAWDTRREPVYAFAPGLSSWDEDAFVAAVEREDEASACAMVRGAFACGLSWADVEHAFARAALAHYADFGHSAIYTYKMRALSDHLGDRDSVERLSLLLTRSIITASREDLIPEFRAYAPALADWDGMGTMVPAPDDLKKGALRTILNRIAAGGADLDALYDACMEAGAWQMLHFDLAWQDRTDSTVSQSVGWLDFTHTLTFGNAVRKLCEAHPELWPQGLFQIGSFLSRNGGFTDPTLDTAAWEADEPLPVVQDALKGVEDHGRFEYIVACHLLKLSFALREEMTERPDKHWHRTAAAALTRFLNSPLKRKHVRRVAHQALTFVGTAG